MKRVIAALFAILFCAPVFAQQPPSGALWNSQSGGPQWTISPTLGNSGATNGSLSFANTSSGKITLSPPSGGLGSVTLTLPDTTSTLACLACIQTFSANQTFSGSLSASNVAITGGSITGMGSPVNPTDVATKQYVDSSAAGLTIHTPVALATTTALAANTYNNGVSGVGATLTANANGNLVIDGTTNPVATTRILVKNESTAANNGIYVVTTTGGASQEYVLTRATDANTPGTANPNEIGEGTYVLVTGGSANGNSSWVVTSTVSTIGTSPINWTQFTAAFTGVSSIGGLTGAVSLGTGLSVSGSTINTPWTVSGSDLYNTTDSVGIGTSSPADTLSVVTTNACCGNNGIGVSGSSADVSIGIKNTGSGGRDWRLDSSDSSSGDPDRFRIVDATAAAGRLDIDASGNILIGSSVTNAGTLTVDTSNTCCGGNAGIALVGSVSDLELTLKNTGSGGRRWALLSTNSSSGTPDSFRIYDETAGADRIDINSSGLVSFPGNTITFGNAYIGGGQPWTDVKSGSHSCAAAVGNGITNDRSAIQCQINWTIANNGYGKVLLPCGQYLVNGGGIDDTDGNSPGAPFLEGETLGCVELIVSDDETALTIGNAGEAQAKPGFENILVLCQAASPTTSCVKVNNGATDIRNCTIQGGNWALEHHGGDGTIFNCFIQGGGGQNAGCTAATLSSPTAALTGCSGNLYTNGPNWYIRDKFDGNSSDFSIYITSTGGSGVTENSFANTDSSDSSKNSLVIYDNGSNHAITTWYGYGPLSQPIYVISADDTLISNANMSGGVSNSNISIIGTICGSSVTGTGTKVTAGNFGSC